MKHLAHILLLVLLTACTGKTQPMKTKAKDNPEVRNMLEVYSKQKHRISFKGCEMLYNDNPFKLGMTIKELESIFGKYDLFNRGFYVWKEAGIVFVTESDDENLDNKAIYI